MSSKTSSGNSTQQKVNPGKENVRLLNPSRVASIKEHRLMRTGFFIPPGTRYITKATVNANYASSCDTASLADHKEMYMKDMDLTVENVFSGRFVKLTILENPIMGLFNAIGCIAEDNNGDAVRFCVYELRHDNNAQKMLGYGRQVAILNPYMRIAMDGKSGLRVDDPKTIVPLGEKVDMCGYCGKENSARKCGSCKRPYCCRECQVADWKKLNHKLVCYFRNYGFKDCRSFK